MLCGMSRTAQRLLTHGLSRVGALIVMLLACMCVAPASSQAAAQLTVSPLIIDLALKPGETATRTVTVTASGDEPLRVSFEHADFGFQENSYAVQIIEDSRPDTVPFSTRGWFRVKKLDYKIKVGASIQVPVRITAPKNATPGTHLGAAFFRTVAADPGGGGARIVTAARSGPLVFVSVVGGSNPKPDLTVFQLPRFVRSGPLRPKIVVSNKGENHFRFSGTVKLSGGGGRRATAIIPDRYVMPDIRRELRDENGERIVLGGRALGIGRHKVTIELLTDPGQKRITDARTIWVIPAWLWFIIIVASIAVVSGLVWIALQLRERRWLRIVAAMEAEEAAKSGSEPGAAPDDGFDDEDAE